jgi:hypothetical protein
MSNYSGKRPFIAKTLDQVRNKTKILDKVKCQLTQQKIQQDVIIYQNLLFHICMKLNMFRVTHRPSSGA